MRTKSAYLRTAALLVVVAKLALCPVFAETFTGTLRLGTQAEVDAASIYTAVTGSVSISGADIVDISPLAGIATVGSYIIIRGNSALTTVVDAFPLLTELPGGIAVNENANLASFSGFDALTQTGDNIDFWYNDSLVTISGFGALHTAGWSLEFGENPLLEQLPAFESLQTISSSLFILDNTSLTKITGFEALQHVDWAFQINGNSELADLSGFCKYFSANDPYSGGGDFDIKDNHPSLPNSTSVGGALETLSCLAPFSLSGFTYETASGDSEVSIRGAAATAYKLVEADDLDFANPDQAEIPLTGASVGTLNGNVVTTDMDGHATVEFNLGTEKVETFVRAEVP